MPREYWSAKVARNRARDERVVGEKAVSLESADDLGMRNARRGNAQQTPRRISALVSNQAWKNGFTQSNSQCIAWIENAAVK